MSHTTIMPGIPGDQHPARRLSLRFAMFFVALFSFAAIPTGSANAATAVGLGTADSYALLSGAGVTNTGPSVINGDLGSAPTPAVTGFGGAPNGTVNGATHQGDAAATSAQADLTTAYNNAAGQGPTTMLATELGGQTLTPGVYNSQSGTFGITGTLTLNAQGDPNAVFIFKTASTLISASSSQVKMVNGAQSCGLFWKVGSSATLGTSSKFAGNILALQSISLNNGVNVDGRLLARNGGVTLINDTITASRCATPGSGGGTGGGGGTGTGGGTGGSGGGTGNGGGGGHGGGTGNGGGGGGNSGGKPGPTATITNIPGGGGQTQTPGGNRRCTIDGFRAKFHVRAKAGIRRVVVSIDGNVVKRSTKGRFSVWIKTSGLRSGKNTIRVDAVDRNGKHDADTSSFRKCAPAVPSPVFTG